MNFIQPPAKDLVNGYSPFIGWTMAQEGPWCLPNQQLCLGFSSHLARCRENLPQLGGRPNANPARLDSALEGKACRTEFNTLGHRSAVHGHATLWNGICEPGEPTKFDGMPPRLDTPSSEIRCMDRSHGTQDMVCI